MRNLINLGFYKKKKKIGIYEKNMHMKFKNWLLIKKNYLEECKINNWNSLFKSTIITEVGDGIRQFRECYTTLSRRERYIKKIQCREKMSVKC